MFANANSQTPWSLSQSVSAALTNRSSIRSQLEKVRAAELQERGVGVEPPLRLEFGYGTQPELGMGNDLLLAVPVDLFGKLSAARAAAHADVLSARATLNQSAVELQTEVFTAFSEYLAAQDELKSAEVLADLSQQSYDATKKRIDNGDLPPNQLLRADLELRRARQTVQTNRLALESAKSNFCGALGVEPDQASTVDPSVFPLPSTAPIEQRPDIELARAAADSARADRNVAKSSNAPDFEFQVAHDYWDSSGRYTARAQFTWNFFDYGASSNKTLAASHNVKAANLALKDLLQQAKAQVAADQAEYNSAVEDLKSYDGFATDARAILEKEQKAFVLGANTLLDVLDATRSYREILDAQAQARSRLITAEGKLLSVTGTVVGNYPELNKP